MPANAVPAVTPNVIQPSDVVRILGIYWRRWLVPTVALALLAAAYGLVRRDWWEASQALAIRNDAANNSEGLGRFRQIDDMKINQDTILEIAKSRAVLSAALREVGPPSGSIDAANWPSDDDVLELRGQIKLTPPKGQEFGKTEIFYLKVNACDRERAVQLVDAVARQLRAGLQQLRKDKAQSMVDELAKSAEMAEAELRASTKCLGELEGHIGCDLGELRMLDLSATGDSDLRRRLESIEHEIRDARSAQQANQELHDLLDETRKNSGNLLATPNRLLESQPALRRLKEGLVDAQLRSSQVLSTMTAAHPQAVSARLTQEEVSRQLHAELAMAIRGVESDLRLTAGRLQMLEDLRGALRSRLDNLASLRAGYSSLASDMKHRTALVEKAQRDLSEARAAQAAAHSVSLISPVDVPEAGNQPVGPGLSVIVMVGLAGGLLTGLGMVFLTVPGAPVAQAVEVAQPEKAAPPVRKRSSSNRGRRDVLSLNDALARVFPMTTNR